MQRAVDVPYDLDMFVFFSFSKFTNANVYVLIAM